MTPKRSSKRYPRPKKRRRKIAELVRRGFSIQAAAKRFGASPRLVRQSCDEFGVKYQRRPRGRPTGTIEEENWSKWKQVDWSWRDIDIAQCTGFSREYVRQMRKNLGAPASKYHRWNKRLMLVNRWVQQNRRKMKGVTLEKMLERCAYRPYGRSFDVADAKAQIVPNDLRKNNRIKQKK